MKEPGGAVSDFCRELDLLTKAATSLYLRRCCRSDCLLEGEVTVIAGVAIRHLRLAPFEPSAALKLKMALLWADRDLPK